MTPPFQRRSSDSWPNRSAAVDCVGPPPAEGVWKLFSYRWTRARQPDQSSLVAWARANVTSRTQKAPQGLRFHARIPYSAWALLCHAAGFGTIWIDESEPHA